jgi:protein-tyrosine-phosphatase
MVSCVWYYLRGVNAKSAGINAASKVDEQTYKILKENGLWNEDFKPQTLSDVANEEFDLIITLSAFAMQKCPDFQANSDIIAIEYDTPDPKRPSSYREALKLIQMEITPIVRMHFEA